MNTIEKLYGEELLKNCELFLYTDNSVLDCAYYRSLSSLRLLFHLILWLRKIQMTDDLIIDVIYISGKRTIEYGVDILSRGTPN